jgi:general secretion pathway protein B
VSYILDALKKSELDQKNRQTPGLNTLHGSPDSVSRSGPITWIVFALVLILANGLFFYWFTRPESTAVTHSTIPSETVFTAPATSEIATNTETLRSSEQRASEPESDEAASYGTDSAEFSGQGLLITPQDFNKKTYSNQESGIRPVRIAELPLNVQRQIPDIIFSSHIYASDPSLRVVNINNRSIREGDYISDDVKLLGITEDGVVLSYLHYRIEMSVIRDWSFD